MSWKEAERIIWFRMCLKEFHRSRGEEIANFITHLVGVIFGIVALTMMCVFSAQNRTALAITSCAIFGTALIVLYTASMLYHVFRDLKIKSLFQLFDHCSIYLLIAASYMPFTLLTLPPRSGWTIFGLQWGLAMLGILLECLCSRKWANILSLPIFICMGWMLALVMPDIFHNMNTTAFWLLVSGGLSYSIGIIFYIMDNVPYMHTVWHVFVLGGSVCHWISITFFMLLD